MELTSRQKLNAWLAEHVCGWERCTDKWCSAENGCVSKDVVCGETGGLDPGTNCKIHVPYPKYSSTDAGSLSLLREVTRGGCHVELELSPMTQSRVGVSRCIIPPILANSSRSAYEYRATGHYLWEMAPGLVKKLVEYYPELDWTKE